MLTYVYALQGMVLVTGLMMHITRKNHSLVWLYTLQSLAVLLLLVWFGVTEMTIGFILSVALTFLVKIVVAPWLFTRLISQNQLKYTASTYLSLPLTLLVLTILMAFTNSHRFTLLPTLMMHADQGIFLSLSSLLASFFLIINRKGILSQMVGVLSLENSIVAFALVLGIRQTVGLEVGILFDISVWIIAAIVLVGLIYRQFGSTESTVLETLTE